MTAKWLREIQNLTASASFLGWWQHLSETRVQLESLGPRAAQTESKARELEERVAYLRRWIADERERAATEPIESVAGEAGLGEVEDGLVRRYENQRILVGDLWRSIVALEHSHGDEDASRDDVELPADEAVRLSSLFEQYSDAAELKQRYREELVRIRRTTLRSGLLNAEREIRKRRLDQRLEAADALIRRTEDDRSRLKDEAAQIHAQREDAQRRELELIEEGAGKFGAICDRDFLYWPQREAEDMVFCVALLDDDATYNIPVVPLGIYQVSRRDGVQRLSAAGPGAGDQQEAKVSDERLDGFFLGRPQQDGESVSDGRASEGPGFPNP